MPSTTILVSFWRAMLNLAGKRRVRKVSEFPRVREYQIEHAFQGNGETIR